LKVVVNLIFIINATNTLQEQILIFTEFESKSLHFSPLSRDHPTSSPYPLFSHDLRYEKELSSLFCATPIIFRNHFQSLSSGFIFTTN